MINDELEAQPVPVEPDVLVKRLRNKADRLDPPHAHEFNEKGQRLGHPGNVVVLLRKSAEHIDTLHQQLQVAQQERDDALKAVDDNWVTHQQVVATRERAEKAEADNKRLVELLREARDDVDEVLQRQESEGQRQARIEYQKKLLHNIDELLREAGK